MHTLLQIVKNNHINHLNILVTSALRGAAKVLRNIHVIIDNNPKYFIAAAKHPASYFPQFDSKGKTVKIQDDY